MKQGLRAVIIGILASFILLLPAYAATFSDVSEYSSYYDAVDYVTQRGIMAGYSEGTFKPDNMLTRGQISAILCRMIGENENLPVNGNIFSDVPESHWANGYITKAVSLGIINGFQDGTFRSLSPVTYNQALAMLIRAFGLRQEAENAGGYPQGYWNVANQNGFLEGVSTKGPSNKGIRRYEIAVIMYNYFQDNAHSYVPNGTENGSPSDAYESDGYTSIPSTLVQSNWSEIGGSDEWCPYFKFADGSRCEIMVTMGEWTEKVPATYGWDSLYVYSSKHPSGTKQIASGSTGDASTFADAEVGDIIWFYNSSACTGNPGHMGIFMGADKTGIWLYDNNIGGKANKDGTGYIGKVRYGHVTYGKNSMPRDYCVIRRPASYVEADFSGNTTNAQTYTITFDANGGSVSPATQTVAEGSLIGQLPTPTRTGYQFLGWFDSKNSGSMGVTPGSIYVNEDQTLYALWKPICTEHTYNEAGVCTKCSAALDYDNGFDSSAAGTYQVSASEALVRSGPYEVKDIVRTLRQGETVEIVGSVVNSYHNTWLKTSDGRYIYGERLERYSTPKPPVQEEAKSFQVILDDGYVCQMMTVTNGQPYGTLPTPSKDGYTFDGWHTKESGGNRITASTIVNLTGNQTLYAHWTKNEPTWTPWREWSTTPVYASGTRQVETRQVKISDSYTEYRYGRYVASGHDCWCGKYLEGLSYVSESARLQYSPWSTTQYGTSGKGWSCGRCSASHIGVDHTGSDGRSWWAEYLLPDGSYYWQETRTVGAVYETQYRYRDLIQ